MHANKKIVYDGFVDEKHYKNTIKKLKQYTENKIDEIKKNQRKNILTQKFRYNKISYLTARQSQFFGHFAIKPANQALTLSKSRNVLRSLLRNLDQKRMSVISLDRSNRISGCFSPRYEFISARLRAKVPLPTHRLPYQYNRRAPNDYCQSRPGSWSV